MGIVLGSIINYFIDPSKSNATFLFSGVAASFIAVCFCSLSSYELEKRKRLLLPRAADRGNGDSKHAAGMDSPNLQEAVELAVSVDAPVKLITLPPSEPITEHYVNGVGARHIGREHSTCNAELPTATEPSRPRILNGDSKKAHSDQKPAGSALKGSIIIFCSGTFTACFSPLFNLATNPDRIDNTPLTPYFAFIIFSIFFCFGSFVLTIGVLRFSGISGTPIADWLALPRDIHVVMFVSGILCACANFFLFISGAHAGFAASTAIALVSPRSSLFLLQSITDRICICLHRMSHVLFFFLLCVRSRIL